MTFRKRAILSCIVIVVAWWFVQIALASSKVENGASYSQNEMNRDVDEISQRMYTENYSETEEDFIANGPHYTSTPQKIKAAINYVGLQMLPHTMKFEILSTPEAGLITGTVKMLQPTGNEVNFTFTNEHGYRAFVRITEVSSRKIVFDGYLYFRTKCFNPFRSALNVTTDVTFTKIGERNSSGPTEKVYFAAGTDNIIDPAKVHLGEKNKKMQILAVRKTGPSVVQEDKLSDPTVLQRECTAVLSSFFPLEKFKIEVVEMHTLSANAYVVNANGDEKEKVFSKQKVIRIKTSGGKMNEFFLEVPTLKLIILKEKYSMMTEYLKPYRNKISASLKRLEKTQVNPHGPEFSLSSPTSLENKTIAVFVGYHEAFSHKQTSWLKDQGFIVKATTNEEEYLSYLEIPPAIMWIISRSARTHLTEKLVARVIDLNQKGCPLWLWADNEPFFVEANLILQKITNDSTFALIRSYDGQNTLVPNSNGSGRGKFDSKHPVSTGFINLYEGVTISYPNKPLPPGSGFLVFANNSYPASTQATILYRLPKAQEGAVWVDTGFTKLYHQPKYDEETKRYLSNVNAYLINHRSL